MLHWPVCQRCQHCSHRQHSPPRRQLHHWPPRNTAAAAALAAAAPALQRCKCGKWSWSRCHKCPSGTRPARSCHSGPLLIPMSLCIPSAPVFGGSMLAYSRAGSSCASRPALYLCKVEQRALPCVPVRHGSVFIHVIMVECRSPCAAGDPRATCVRWICGRA